MKVLISHDVDHIGTWEHRDDLFIPKHLTRSLIETFLGFASVSEMLKRLKNIISNRCQNIEELAGFDKTNNIPSTFFIAVRNGRQISYAGRVSEKWIKWIRNAGFDVGVHGIEYDDYGGIKDEYELFMEYSGLEGFGIRVHDIGMKKEGDVKITQEGLKLLSKAGYSFSSNTFELRNPFKAGNIWEFPITVMDGYIFSKGAKWHNRTLDEAKDETKKLMDAASSAGIDYLNILFHDFYFSSGFGICRDWYCWLIKECRERGFEFINYKNAILELNSREKDGQAI
jgi:hypothetical protein